MSEQRPPLVTVLLPAYNAEKYLAEAIESILSQTFRDIEFLIINDGSTDNSESIIKQYDDPRIRYIKNEHNLKLVATLNKGVKLAKGKYIVRMDADDISHHDRIKKQVEYMERHPDIGVCGSFLYVFGDGIKPHLSMRPKANEYIKASLLTANPIGHPNVIIRKSVMTSQNIYYSDDYYRMEDWGLWVSLMNVCNFHNIQEVLLDYRWVASSESRQNKKDAKHLEISTRITTKFFSQARVPCSQEEGRLITSIIKAPYVYAMPWAETKKAYRVLSSKLKESESQVPGVSRITYKRLAAFSVRNHALIIEMVKDIGILGYVKALLGLKAQNR